MRLDQIFQTDCFNENMASQSGAEALSELIDVLVRSGRNIDPATTLNILLQREKLGTTGIGDGVAIPHGKTADLDDIVVSFGRSHKGVAFDSVDGKPVHLFFLLLAPENSTGQHLKALARISRMLKKKSFRKKLMIAETKEDLYNIIVEQDEF